MMQNVDLEPPPRAMERREEPSLRELLVELFENSERLVRKEFELVLAEFDSRITHIKTELLGVTIAAAVMYGGILAVLASLVLLLALVMAPWLSALIVGVAACGGGFVLLQKSKENLEPRRLAPERTAENLKRDVRTVKEAGQ